LRQKSKKWRSLKKYRRQIFEISFFQRFILFTIEPIMEEFTMGKKRRIIAASNKFAAKHSSHPRIKAMLSKENNTTTNTAAPKPKTEVVKEPVVAKPTTTEATETENTTEPNNTSTVETANTVKPTLKTKTKTVTATKTTAKKKTTTAKTTRRTTKKKTTKTNA